MPENYIRQYAANILSYEPFIRELVNEDRAGKKKIEGDNPSKIFRAAIDTLNKPVIGDDAQKVLGDLRKFYDAGDACIWPERIERYVQSIFPPPIVCPYVQKKKRSDLRRDEIAIDPTILNAERAVNVARWMNRLQYLVTKKPEDWMEWELLKPRPYDVQAIKREVDALQDDCGGWLEYFCDEDGSLRSPAYNEISLFLEKILLEPDENRRQYLASAFGCLQNFFMENSVHRLIFEDGKLTKWEPDLFRFERPDMIEGKWAGSGVGTVRVVMPAGCAGVGLNNHFPREAYRVVAEQVSPLRKKERNGNRATGISDEQLIQVIVSVMEDKAREAKEFVAKNRTPKSYYNDEMMDYLENKSIALFDVKPTKARQSFSKTRFYRKRLAGISKKAGKSNLLVDKFDEWLKALR
ncbi:hypothetical protein [Pontiella desulfatans]|nr:hypothetical protein [Pontiella desulfatans]